MFAHRPGSIRPSYLLACLAVAMTLFATNASGQTGVQLNGTNQYITFGTATSLGTSTFTIELWFRRDGAGITTTTGTGGLPAAVPLVTKGRGEGEAPANLNMNYFFGISNNTLAADFEDTGGGLNHPVFGTTQISTGVWYHAALTYDGTTQRLYLNGVLDTTKVVNATPEATSIQHAGIGTAMTSSGGAAGYFQGAVDEARIWNVARTQSDIQASMYSELTGSETGLLGRWGLNDGSGAAAANSKTGGVGGTLMNGATWTTGSPSAFTNSLKLGSGTGYVTFGQATATLGLAQFTLETWFRRDGAGSTANSGTGGVLAIPLIAKGVGEGENSDVDANYFLGIRATDNLLCADFEEGATGLSPGLNHPIVGVTPILAGSTWHHAAVTYDGNKWQLFLDGVLENELVVGQPPRSDSRQHAGLGAALNSTGAVTGHFDGTFDEARIWNSARTQAQIRTTINARLTGAQTGLVARWGLDEGAGTTVRSTAGTTINGTIMGTGFTWNSPATFNLSFGNAAPTASNVAISGTPDVGQVLSGNYTYNDADSDPESGTTFRWLRNDVAIGGAAAQSYTVVSADAGTALKFEVTPRASAGTTPGVAVASSPVTITAKALNFGTGTAYVTFGTALGLNAATFTLETWFIRQGAGTTASSGASGVVAIPLVTKGLHEADGSNVDMNYFLGIDGTTGVLVADFEDMATGLNHPVAGVTAIANDTWYHAAVTYDGTKWQLFLNGTLERELTVGQAPRSDCIQHAGLGVAMNSTGVTEGHFVGILDEVRIWNVARTQAQIRSTINTEITTTQTNLIGRWSLNGSANASAGTATNGTLNGTGSSWTTGAPFNITNGPPTATNVAISGNQGIGQILTGSYTYSDPDGDAQGTSTFRWLRNDVAIAGATLIQYTTVALDDGAVLKFEVTPVALTGATPGSPVPSAPFNNFVTLPAPPTTLLVSGMSSAQVTLGWSDNSANETAFVIERSSIGNSGPFSVVASVGADVTACNDATVAPATMYWYRVRATNGGGSSGFSNVAYVTTTPSANYALDFGSASAYATFGLAPSLATPNFTVEVWFKRTGTGTANTTGSGGIDIIPLIAKGSPEAEASTVDENYILGIQSVTNVLGADFEEGTGSLSPGLNHPIVGTTPITLNVWHHAAATFSAGVFSLYLDGNLEDTLRLAGRFPQGLSIQHASLGTMITSGGDQFNGRFLGVLDEARVWNYARTQTEIRAGLNTQITTNPTGLLGRWGLDDGIGAVIASANTPLVPGSIVGTGYSWVQGAPFNLPVGNAPEQPTAINPADNATGITTPVTLSVGASDPDGGSLTVNVYGRPVTASSPTFTLVALPDAQNYTALLGGGTSEIFKSQTRWIVSNLASRNIAFVSQLGDITNDGDNAEVEWKRADTVMSILEAPQTGFPNGIPYGIGIGNHDQTTGTAFYNQYFGSTRFTGRSYYGGHYGANNNNYYEFFSSGGLDFIVINLEYGAVAAVRQWANGLLAAHPSKRGIVIYHNLFVSSSDPATFSPDGQAVYDSLKVNPNLFLMLAGHWNGETRRTDVFNGNTVHSVLSDFQNFAHGGDGWLRVMEFDPPNDVIHVTTYSPSLDQSRTGASSQFDLPYTMSASSFQLIGTRTIASGSSATIPWPELTPSTRYEWYATVSDGPNTTTGPTWVFTTSGAQNVSRQLYVAKSPSIASPDTLYPHQGWGGDYQDPGTTADWGFSGSEPISMYIVPEQGTAIGLSDLTMQWDPAMLTLVNVDFTGSIYDDPHVVIATYDRLGTDNQVRINASLSAPNNATITGGSYLARLNFTLARPGRTEVSVVSNQILYYNANSTTNPLTITPHSGFVRAFLGDVASSAAGTTSGDGKLDINDLNLWSTSYWSGVPGYAPNMLYYMTKYDIGPTMNGYIFSLPAHLAGSTLVPGPDRRIDFEDLVLFSITYRLSSLGTLPKPPQAPPGTVTIAAGEPRPAGAETHVPVYITGAVNDVRAASIAVAGQFGQFLGVEKGALLQTYATPVTIMSRSEEGKAYVDLAVLGLDAKSVNSPGELVILRFDAGARVSVVSADCRTSMNRSMTASGSTGAKREIPTTFGLSQNYPNPFNPATNISYAIPVTAQVEITIYSVLGERVATLVNQIQEPGLYDIRWDGRNDHQHPVPSGIYFYRMQAGDFHDVRKMLLLK